MKPWEHIHILRPTSFVKSFAVYWGLMMLKGNLTKIYVIFQRFQEILRIQNLECSCYSYLLVLGQVFDIICDELAITTRTQIKFFNILDFELTKIRVYFHDMNRKYLEPGT